MRSLRVVPPEQLPADGEGASEPTGEAGNGGIVVEAEDGERFQLTVDDALRSAVGLIDPPAASSSASARARAHHAHPLSPREIQTRVRAGESAQELSDDSGTSMDKIMRFAYAVIEERSRVADEARRARARRDGDGNLVPFGETVDSRFSAHAIEPQSVEWDSFRRPDGSWVVSASWTADGTERTAHWAFSLTARTVLPLDQVSSDLLSDRPLRPVVQAVPDGENAPTARELYDQEAPDAAGYTAPPPPVGWLRPSGGATAAARSGTHLNPQDNPPLPLRLAEPWSEDDKRTGEDFDASRDDRDDLDGEGADGIDIGGDTKLDELFDDDFVDDGAHAAPTPATPPTDPSAAATPASGRSRGSRGQTKVPRWDDILLSTRRKHD